MAALSLGTTLEGLIAAFRPSAPMNPPLVEVWDHSAEVVGEKLTSPVSKNGQASLVLLHLATEFMTTSNIADILADGPVIPVIVVEDADHAVPLAKALVAGGVRVLEVTLRTDAGLESIRRMIAGGTRW